MKSISLKSLQPESIEDNGYQVAIDFLCPACPAPRGHASHRITLCFDESFAARAGLVHSVLRGESLDDLTSLVAPREGCHFDGWIDRGRVVWVGAKEPRMVS